MIKAHLPAHLMCASSCSGLLVQLQNFTLNPRAPAVFTHMIHGLPVLAAAKPSSCLLLLLRLRLLSAGAVNALPPQASQSAASSHVLCYLCTILFLGPLPPPAHHVQGCHISSGNISPLKMNSMENQSGYQVSSFSVEHSSFNNHRTIHITTF